MAIKGNAQIEWRVLFFRAFVSLLGISLISLGTAMNQSMSMAGPVHCDKYRCV